MAEPRRQPGRPRAAPGDHRRGTLALQPLTAAVRGSPDMPSTVAETLAAAGAKRAGVVRWGELPDRPRRAGSSTTGLYIVALTDAVDRANGLLAKAPVSLPPLKKLLER